MSKRKKSIVRRYGSKNTAESNITSTVGPRITDTIETTLTGQRTFLFVGLIFAFIGVAMIIATVFFFTKQTTFIESAQTAPGIVTELAYVTSSEGGGTYAPVVRFNDATGRERIFQSKVSSSPPSHREGEAVEVLYDPADPLHAEINSFWSLWLMPIIFGFIGSLFLPIGLFTAYQGRRKLRR